MFGSEVLDIGIGLVFVYLLLSLVCSAVGELLEGFLRNRAVNLEGGIRALLADPAAGGGSGLATRLLSHGLVKSLTKDGEPPSYMPPHTFALALLDVLLPADAARVSGAVGGGAPGATSLQPLRDAVAAMQNTQVKSALLPLIDVAGNDVTKLRESVERWFNAAMDRVSGWYRRRSQRIIFAAGLLIVSLLNVDSVLIATALSHDAALRSSLVAAAQQAAKNPLPAAGQSAPEAEKQIKTITDKIQTLGLPVGWSGQAPLAGWGWVTKLLGLLLTAFAISLGAPFWFDMLNKFISVRTATKPAEPTTAKT